MKRESNIKNCSEKLYKLCDEVNRLNNLNYYDINISCENFYMNLLNLVYSWNLRNINHETNNATAIDLYDDENKVAVQVTFDDSAKKIHNTIKNTLKWDMKKSMIVLLLL